MCDVVTSVFKLVVIEFGNRLDLSRSGKFGLVGYLIDHSNICQFELENNGIVELIIKNEKLSEGMQQNQQEELSKLATGIAKVEMQNVAMADGRIAQQDFKQQEN